MPHPAKYCVTRGAATEEASGGEDAAPDEVAARRMALSIVLAICQGDEACCESV